MKTTLENLPKVIQENRLKNLAINIVKYQKFRTSEIIKKIDNGGYSKWSLLSYINNGIRYIETGDKIKQSGNLYIYIDEAIANCVQPLTPNYEERRIYKNKRPNFKQETTLPVQKVLKEINTKNIIQPKLAIQLENSLVIICNEQEACGFNKCLEFLGKQAGKVVKITIEEV